MRCEDFERFSSFRHAVGLSSATDRDVNVPAPRAKKRRASDGREATIVSLKIQAQGVLETNLAFFILELNVARLG